MRVRGDFTNFFRPQRQNQVENRLQTTSTTGGGTARRAELSFFGAANRFRLENKYNLQNPSQGNALDAINNLLRPNPNDSQAVSEYKTERRTLAENAIENLVAPRRSDFSNLPPGIANVEYQDALTFYNSQLAELNQIAEEAERNPDRIITPSEALQEIGELPYPAADDAETVREFNERRAQIADDALMFAEPPNLSDYENLPPSTANYEYQNALDLYNSQIAELEDISAQGNRSAMPIVDNEEAQRIADSVETAYQNALTNCEDPTLAASHQLEELTRNLTPEETALVLQYAQPMIDRIAADLGIRAESDDGSYGDDRRFDEIISNLAAVTNKAALAPNGEEIVNAVAASLVANIDPEEIGRFDEAFGKAIENGHGAQLSLAVVSQLNAAGRIGQADDVLQNIEDGINALNDEIQNLQDSVQGNNEELSFLIQEWSPVMDEQSLADAIENYKRENPEYVENLERLDELGAAGIRTIDSLGELPPDLLNLDHYDDVQNALSDFVMDEDIVATITQSLRAQDEINYLQAYANIRGEEFNLFEIIGNTSGTGSDGLFVREEYLNLLIRNKVEFAVAEYGRFKRKPVGSNIPYNNQVAENIGDATENLRRYADDLGFDQAQFDAVFDDLDRIRNARGKDALRNALRSLERNLNTLPQDALSQNSSLRTTVRSAGILLGGLSLGGAISEQKYAEIVVETFGLAGDLSQTTLAQSLVKNKTLLARLGTAGWLAGWASVAIDSYNILQSLDQGDYVNAGLRGASAVGGVLLLTGSTGVGLVLVGGALVGGIFYSQYQKHQASVKFESDGAMAFLEGAGFSPELADELINNDDVGRSAIPVLTALAENAGIEPSEWFDYLMTLEPEDAKRLIEKAHGVDPNDEGVYPVDINGTYGDSITNHNLEGWGTEIIRVDDLTDLTIWMQENGFEDAPIFP